VALFRHAYDRGITFFDLADLYGTHIYLREALRTIPRDKVAILTKLWWRYDGPEKDLRASHRKHAVHKALQRFRHEINTDYLDIVLLHCLTKGGWENDMKVYMEALAEAKEKKQVRAVGVSCHDLGAMKTAAACPWVDVLLARINPKGVMMDGTPDEVIEVLRQTKANGKAVIGMKILGEGQLREQRENCIQFAQELGLLDAMTIGFEKPEQIDDVLRLIAKYPARPVA
jgi:aryl-alcohol dehydrogenase-like predicted oxidoreductase